MVDAADREAVLCSDQLSDAKTLSLGIPASLTFAVFTNRRATEKARGCKELGTGRSR